MSKDDQVSKVFVKYIPRPGRPERTNIGGRFFNSNPRLEQSRFGDLIDVEFVKQYRDALEGAGCLIFDAEGVQKTIKEYLANLPKELRDEARDAAAGLKDALGGVKDPEEEVRKRDAEEEKVYQKALKKHGPNPPAGKFLVPTRKMFVGLGFDVAAFEHRFCGFNPGDVADEQAIHENQKKLEAEKAAAAEEEKRKLAEAGSTATDSQQSLGV